VGRVAASFIRCGYSTIANRSRRQLSVLVLRIRFLAVRLKSRFDKRDISMRQIFSLSFLGISLVFGPAALAAGSTEANDLSAFTHPTEIYDVAKGSRPRIASDNSGQLHVVYEGHEKDLSVKNIFYTKSSDGGMHWTPAVNISNTSGTPSQPDIAVEQNGAVDVVWADTNTTEASPDIYFARSSDGGTSWSQPRDISNTLGASVEPVVATGPDSSIQVVWCDLSQGEKNKEIYYIFSTDAGRTWGKDPLFTAEDISNTPGSSIEPAIAVGQDGVVHVAWLDSTPGESHPDIYYVRKENGVWTKSPTNVSHSPRVSDHPTIGCGPKGKVYISWLDYSQKPTAPDIWCAISGKDGHFEKPINVSNTPGVSSMPVLAADMKGQVVLVWSDTSKTFRNPDIFARISNDCAKDFTRVMDISNTRGFSTRPHVTISGNKVFVIWEEVEDSLGILKLTSLGLENLATGPPTDVEPTVHGASSNAR